MSATQQPDAASPPEVPHWGTLMASAIMGLVLVKFATPPVMLGAVDSPHGFWEYALFEWPMGWGLFLLALAVVAGGVGAFCGTLPTIPKTPLLWLPTAWLVWQYAASVSTIDPALTRPTLTHFTAAVFCFYLGLLAFQGPKARQVLLAALACGFALSLFSGIYQHFWGLEMTRKYFEAQLAEHPEMVSQLPDGFLVKIQSNRIWATFFYPNSFAAGIVFLLPVLLVCAWEFSKDLFEPSARIALVVIAGLAGLACLFWTGSKTGWLIAMLLAVGALFRVPFDRRIKLGLVAVMLAGGLAAFFIKNQAYFQKGAKSVGARVEYWQAAVDTANDHPWLGAGPGTFFRSFEKRKRPEAELARLAHNDFLQQASDSGWPGCLLYMGLVWGILARAARQGLATWGWRDFAFWLGLLGWALSSCMEFNLYSPALGWTAFLLLGVQLQPISLDKTDPAT